jgi:hypothetical protein
VLLPDGWFRERPDSSTLPPPRLLARRFVHPDDLDDQIAFYERALGHGATRGTPTEPSGSRTRMRYPDGTLVEVIDSRPLPDEI